MALGHLDGLPSAVFAATTAAEMFGRGRPQLYDKSGFSMKYDTIVGRG
jgi:hypothetical protein